MGKDALGNAGCDPRPMRAPADADGGYAGASASQAPQTGVAVSPKPGKPRRVRRSARPRPCRPVAASRVRRAVRRAVAPAVAGAAPAADAVAPGAGATAAATETADTARPAAKRAPADVIPDAAPIARGAPAAVRADVPVYTGPFGRREAERLLWRAGFGPAPGQAKDLASRGIFGAVGALTRPEGGTVLSGPAPVDDEGDALAPFDSWGHDHLYWLDRMVRTNQPLRERMALIWHDWFATSLAGVDSQKLMISQYKLFRSSFLGSFKQLLKNVTIDPAMLLWLNGIENTRWDPNENYAREVMELFTLGADRGAYSEADVRELARALADRVLVHAWSEFGRRPQENGSGTDHGAGGASFVIGSQARGTMVGEFPGLSSLDDDDNLRSTSDFRGLYCSLLEQWMGVDAEPIIPNASSFSRPSIVKP